MSRLWHSGFELNSITNLVEFDTNSAPVSIVTTNPRSGTYHGRVNGGVGFWRTQHFSSNQTTVGYVGVAFLVHAAVNANSQILRLTTVGNVQVGSIQLNTDNTIQLNNASSVKVGSSTAAVANDTWHYIELKVDGNATPGPIEGRLDGVVFATGTNASAGSWARSIVGCITGTQTTNDIYFDDWKMNNSSGTGQTSYPGIGNIVHVYPAATGDVNTFAVQVGGTAGSANNWTRVNQIPPDDGTSYNASAILNQEDLFAVSASGIASGSTINVVLVGVRFANIITIDNTTSIKAEIEKTSAGTILQSAALDPDQTTWATNNNTDNPSPYPISAVNDPDGAAWTTSTLATMQIGYKLITSNVQSVGVTLVWAAIDYTPTVVVGVTSFLLPMRIANKNVGPMALRYNFRQPIVINGLRPSNNYIQSLSGTYSVSGQFSTRAISRQFTAIYSAVGALTKRAVVRSLSATYSVIGSLTRKVSHVLTNSVFSTSGVLSKQEGKTFVAVFISSGQILSRVIGKLLTAQFKTIGLLSRVIKRNLFGILLVSGQNAPLNLNSDFEIAPVSNIPQTLHNNWIDGTSTGSASRGVFGWYGNQIAAGVSWMFSQAQVHSGLWSMQMITVGNTITMMSVAPGFGVVNQGAIPAIVGASYTASVWVNVTAATGSAATGLELVVYTSNYDGTNGNPSSTAATKLTAVTGGWVHLSVTLVAGAKDNWLNPMIRVVTTDGAATLAMTAYIDDFTFTYTTISPFGSFMKKTMRSLSATLSGSGVVTTQHGFSKLLTGVFSTSGAITSKFILRLFTATQNASGAIVGRILSYSLAAIYSATGFLTRFMSFSFGGTENTSGVLTSNKSNNTHFQSLSAAYSTSGILIKSTARRLSAVYQMSGSFNRLFTRKLIATFQSAGVLNTVKSHLKSLAATFSTSGTLKRSVSRLLVAVYKTLGNLKKITFRIFSAVYRTVSFWQRFIKPHWSKVGVTISSGEKTTIDVSGSSSGKVSGGDILDSVRSGTKNEALRSGDDDTTVSGSDTKAQL